MTSPTVARSSGSCAARWATKSDSEDRKSTRLNSSHGYNSYSALCFDKEQTDCFRFFRFIKTVQCINKPFNQYCKNITNNFFNETATTEIFPLSQHDALPI